MWATTEPQTFAAYGTRCMTCEGEVQYLYRDDDGKSRIAPCGHAAQIRLVLNPRLSTPRP